MITVCCTDRLRYLEVKFSDLRRGLKKRQAKGKFAPVLNRRLHFDKSRQSINASERISKQG